MTGAREAVLQGHAPERAARRGMHQARLVLVHAGVTLLTGGGDPMGGGGVGAARTRASASCIRCARQVRTMLLCVVPHHAACLQHTRMARTSSASKSGMPGRRMRAAAAPDVVRLFRGCFFCASFTRIWRPYICQAPAPGGLRAPTEHPPSCFTTGATPTIAFFLHDPHPPGT